MRYIFMHIFHRNIFCHFYMYFTLLPSNKIRKWKLFSCLYLQVICRDCMVVGFTTICAICLSPLMLWVRTPFMVRCLVLNTTLCDKVCQWLATGLWFSLGTLVSSTNKADRHDITEICLKVALITINQPTLI